MNLGNDRALWFLFAVPAILLPAHLWCFWQKARALRILASSQMLKRINDSVSLKKQVLKALLLLASFISIVVALTEPKWNPQAQKIKRRGRDICILLDTSRSMLAEDIKPSRRQNRTRDVCRQQHRKVPADSGLRFCENGAGGCLPREYQPRRHNDR
jgi:Ca-activated chloride channel family protein